MVGTSPSAFAPNENTTRAQLTVILYRYSGSPQVTGASPFADLSDDWYKDAVTWAYQNKIVYDVTETLFAPNQEITREQMVTIFYRYCKEYKNMNVSGIASISAFPDTPNVSSYALRPFQWAVQQEYIRGVAQGNQKLLMPQGNGTRAQIAAIMTCPASGKRRWRCPSVQFWD